MKYSQYLVLATLLMVQIAAAANDLIINKRKTLLIRSLQRQKRRHARNNYERVLQSSTMSPATPSSKAPSYSTKTPRGTSTRAPVGYYSTKAPDGRGGGVTGTGGKGKGKGKGSGSSKTPKSSKSPKKTKSPTKSKDPKKTKGPKKTKSPTKSKEPKKTKGPKKTKSPKGGRGGKVGGAQSSAFSMHSVAKITSTVIACVWLWM